MTLLELAQTRAIDCSGLDLDTKRLIEAIGCERWLECNEPTRQSRINSGVQWGKIGFWADPTTPGVS